MTNTETEEPLADWERELLERPTAPLPELLDLADRCDRCGAQAWHAAIVTFDEGAQVMLFCNHHWRTGARRALDGAPHKDYRMTLDEAERLNADERKRVETDKSLEAIYREVPRFKTQWDA